MEKKNEEEEYETISVDQQMSLIEAKYARFLQGTKTVVVQLLVQFKSCHVM